MTEETAERMVELLEDISLKLDGLEQIQSTLNSLDDMMHEIKLEVCALEHEGNRYPSLGDKIETAIESVQSELNSLSSTLSAIEINTSS